jgi:hypothetical protein
MKLDMGEIGTQAKCLGSRITTMMCLPVRDDKDMSILHGIIFIGNRVPG